MNTSSGKIKTKDPVNLEKKNNLGFFLVEHLWIDP